MGVRLDGFKTGAEILKLCAEVYDLIVGKRAERARQDEDDERDRKIKELEDEVKKLKEKEEHRDT
jgi:hypothetical protein